MNLFDYEEEKKKEFDAIGFENQRKSLKVSQHQTGTSNKKRDIVRKALAPGKEFLRMVILIGNQGLIDQTNQVKNYNQMPKLNF